MDWVLHSKQQATVVVFLMFVWSCDFQVVTVNTVSPSQYAYVNVDVWAAACVWALCGVPGSLRAASRCFMYGVWCHGRECPSSCGQTSGGLIQRAHAFPLNIWLYSCSGTKAYIICLQNTSVTAFKVSLNPFPWAICNITGMTHWRLELFNMQVPCFLTVPD